MAFNVRMPRKENLCRLHEGDIHRAKNRPDQAISLSKPGLKKKGLQVGLRPDSILKKFGPGLAQPEPEPDPIQVAQ